MFEKPFEDIRTARLALLEQQTRHEKAEADYAELKLDELRRASEVDINSGPEDNILTFANQINEATVYKAIHTLGIFSRRRPGSDITIYLTSPGGSGMAGFALYDYILDLRRRGHKVTCIAIGYCMSMAVTILQAADERVMGANAFLLVHEAQIAVEQTSYSEHTDIVKRTARIQDRVFQALADRSNLSVKQLRLKAKKNEWLIDAEEALSHGLIDRIA